MERFLTLIDSVVPRKSFFQKLKRDIIFFFYFYLFIFFNCFYLLFIYYFYFWLCWVFLSVRGLSPIAASGGHSSSRCAGLSLSRPLLLRSTGSRRSGSVVVAHGPSCSVACGIFPDQGSNPCPLHWQADSQPLRHPGSPSFFIFKLNNSLLQSFTMLICVVNDHKIRLTYSVSHT